MGQSSTNPDGSTTYLIELTVPKQVNDLNALNILSDHYGYLEGMPVTREQFVEKQIQERLKEEFKILLLNPQLQQTKEQLEENYNNLFQ